MQPSIVDGEPSFVKLCLDLPFPVGIAAAVAVPREVIHVWLVLRLLACRVQASIRGKCSWASLPPAFTCSVAKRGGAVDSSSSCYNQGRVDGHKTIDGPSIMSIDGASHFGVW